MLRLLLSAHCRRAGGYNLDVSTARCISSTASLSASWMDKVKGVLTGQKTTAAAAESSAESAESFTLLRFAEEMRKARKLGSLKQYVVGRGSEATFADAFEKQEAIIRYLGGFDPTGENIQTSQKTDAAKHCNCTILDVENALAKFTWAKNAQKKIEQLKAEGKPMPKNLGEIQKLMGSSPLDVARSSMAKSGQISRNAPCPCGSKKLYKRYLLGLSRIRSRTLFEQAKECRVVGRTKAVEGPKSIVTNMGKFTPLEESFKKAAEIQPSIQ